MRSDGVLKPASPRSFKASSRLRRALRLRCSALSFQGCAISGIFHCMNYGLRRRIALDAHRICQQADRACRDTRHFRYCLFNPAAACRAAMPVTVYCFMVSSYLLTVLIIYPTGYMSTPISFIICNGSVPSQSRAKKTLSGEFPLYRVFLYIRIHAALWRA